MRNSPSAILAILAIAASSYASGCTPSFRECAPVESGLLAAVPQRLSETGLFADVKTETLGEGVQPFAPRFELWSDGATKRRWISLPRGTQIDTTDPDAWKFPVGTKLWKEFTREGVRIETRMLFKHDLDAWTPVAYVWSDQEEAWAMPEGAPNARGTKHDVPSAGQCVGCHGGTASGALGFSAIQLPKRGEGDNVGLDTLEEARLVSTPFQRSNDLPGDATTQEALGYLHANCSHCHNRDRPERSGPRCFDPRKSIDFMLRLAEIDRPQSTAAYRTAVGEVIAPGDPSASDVVIRIHSRDPWWGMPALGTEDVDQHGAEILETWIRSLGDLRKPF